ncbi:MarR family winged helix-turn-helix transcriptional regulator [Fredinandcohnia sp. 179-A 10B2 NHS]|uniref:MarR family winged helix-turn-helix transcriptional regulator n=1 Tax=Fredinandcohnia sp. 179-A 10B2 NHS TaxID=3235176 RepID=UPI00399F0A57
MDIKNYTKETFKLLDKVNSLLLREFESILQYELTPKQSMLIQFVHIAKTITVNELALQMNTTASAVSQLLNKLEKEDYIKREINPENRREILISLGLNGLKLYEEYDKIDQRVIDKYFSKLTTDEMVQFRAVIEKLHTIITDENDKG